MLNKKVLTLLIASLVTISFILSTSIPAFADTVNWTAKGPEGGGVDIDRIIIDPQDTSKIYAFRSTSLGPPSYSYDNDIYFSSDSGATWIKLDELELYEIFDIKVDPVNSYKSYLLATRSYYDSFWGWLKEDGIYKNTQSFQGSWINKNSKNVLFAALSIAPGSPEVIYAGLDASEANVGQSPALKLSTNEGESWQTKIGLLNPVALMLGITGIAVSPTDPEKIIFGSLHFNTAGNYGAGVYISTNEGVSYIRTQPVTTERTMNDSKITPFIREGTYSAGEINAYAFLTGSSLQSLIFFRSTNEGESWETLNYPSVRPISIDVCKSSFGTVYFCISASLNSKVYKSTDYGTSWQEKPNGLPADQFNYVAVDPSDPDIVYLATEKNGIYKTADGGDSWTDINVGIGSGDIGALSIVKQNPSDIYVANNAFPDNFYKSTNYSDTWNTLTGLKNVRQILTAPDSTNEVYVRSGPAGGNKKSTDGGQSFSDIADPRVGTRESLYDWAISEADSTHYFQSGKKVYLDYTKLEDGKLYKSTNEAQSWFELTGTYTQGSIEVAAIIAPSPSSPEVIYKGRNWLWGDNFWAIRKSTDGGQNFNPTNDPASMVCVNDIAVHPTDPNIVLVVCGNESGDEGIWKTTDGGSNWTQKSLPAGIGYPNQIEICSSDPDIVYVSLIENSLDGVGIWKSSNGGDSFNQKISGFGTQLEDDTPVSILAADPLTYPILYAGTANGVYKGIIIPTGLTPTVETISPSKGNQFYSTNVTITGNFFFNLQRVYLKNSSYDLTVSSYTPTSINATVPLFVDPGTYEVMVQCDYGTSVSGPVYESLPASLDGPIFSNIKFNDRKYTAGDPISTVAKITGRATDEHMVSPESISLGFHNLTDDSWRGIPAPQAGAPAVTIEFEYSIGEGGEAPLSSGNYDIYISARDLDTSPGSPEGNVGVWLGQVKVYGGPVQIIGDVLTYPAPFKALGGDEVRIAYNLTQDAPVSVFIFDVSGQVILTKKFAAGSMGGHAGYNDFTWNGVSDFGGYVGNGIYVIKVTSGSRNLATGKLVVFD